MAASGDHQQSIEDYRRALRILKTGFPLRVATCRYNLGLSLLELKRERDAARELDAAVTGFELLMGPEHPQTRSAQEALQRASGEPAASEPRARSPRRASHGSGIPAPSSMPPAPSIGPKPTTALPPPPTALPPAPTRSRAEASQAQTEAAPDIGQLHERSRLVAPALTGISDLG